MGIKPRSSGMGVFLPAWCSFLCVGVIWEVEAGGSRVGIRIVIARRPKWGGTKASGRGIREESE